MLTIPFLSCLKNTSSIGRTNSFNGRSRGPQRIRTLSEGNYGAYEIIQDEIQSDSIFEEFSRKGLSFLKNQRKGYGDGEPLQEPKPKPIIQLEASLDDENTDTDMDQDDDDDNVFIDGEKRDSLSSFSNYSTAEEDSFSESDLSNCKNAQLQNQNHDYHHRRTNSGHGNGKSVAIVNPLKLDDQEDHNDDDENPAGRSSNPMTIITEGLPINVDQLQMLLNCFKTPDLSPFNCETILEFLRLNQHNDDFQWALHQLGGFNCFLFLFARVVEICNIEGIQTMALSLALNQLKIDRYKILKTHEEVQNQTIIDEKLHLLRFVLNSESCAFGHDIYTALINHCVSSSGNKLIDYNALKICLFSSWKKLIKIRVAEDSPGTSTSESSPLLQILFLKILDLLIESNPHRQGNIGLFKKVSITSIILSICYNITFEFCCDHYLDSGDAIKITSVIREIFDELMAPPDAQVILDLVKFGLCPFLPHDLPPIPKLEDSYFVYKQEKVKNVDQISTNFSTMYPRITLEEAQEIGENHYHHPDVQEQIQLQIANEDDIPELLGIQWKNRRNSQTILNQSEPMQCTTSTSARSNNSFKKTFVENLTQDIMTIILRALPILPDGSFTSVLSPHLSPHIFVAYCSHTTIKLKNISLRLLSAYLSRLDHTSISEFVTKRGFFLTSLYIQSRASDNVEDNFEIAELIVSVCKGYGPVSYPLLISLLRSPTVVSNLIEWIKEDETGKIPTLYSIGLVPAIITIFEQIQSQSSIQIQVPQCQALLQNLLSLVTRYCTTSAKIEPWKMMLVPGIESAASCSILFTSRIIKEAIEQLRNYDGISLKRNEYSSRLLWLMEKGVAYNLGHYFDNWLANLWVQNVMTCAFDLVDFGAGSAIGFGIGEMMATQNWKYFVKKYRKRLNYIFGVFLCKIFAPSYGDLHIKHEILQIIFQNEDCNLWLPQVLKCDEGIERCFTAFFRIFNKASRTEQQRKYGHSEARRGSSAAIGIPLIRTSTLSGGAAINYEDVERECQPNSEIRDKFESILITHGILMSTNHGSFYSDFGKSQKVFGIESPHMSSVSFQEIRFCQTLLNKMQSSFLPKSSSGSFNQDIPVQLDQQHQKSNFMTIFQSTKSQSYNSGYFDHLFESVVKYSLDVLDTITRVRTQQEIQMVRIMSVRDEDIIAKSNWWKVIEQMTHPKAPWFFPDSYPENSLSLDQSEGPGRIRIRLRKERLKIGNSFIKIEHRREDLMPEPLTYLFENQDHEHLALPLINSNVIYMRLCNKIIPGEEIPGEIILSEDFLYFVPESSQFRQEQIQVQRSLVLHALKRRYNLEDRALEVFVECRSYFIVFQKSKDREEFLQFISPSSSMTSVSSSTKQVASKLFLGTGTLLGNSTLLDSSLVSMTCQWAQGHLSNYDYLMFLNTMAGRTFCDLMQYPVYPFVLAQYESQNIDLNAPESYRNLKKPMAIQDPTKEKHFINNYNYLRSEELGSNPFHYGSHYSNSGIVLHFLIRLPPYTQHFLRYQDGSFDIPDRSFHSLSTTWRLASKESNTDFKESIPEFYYLPEIFKNTQNFDFGVRQNGQRVDDVVLPPWAKGDARLFTLINRQALESNHVRKYLHEWIDLIFGYKQTGKAAENAINVFHPSTYEGFQYDGYGDELMAKARKAMTSTYGQMPKQLFNRSHLKSQLNPIESYEREVLDTVCGVKWGKFVGSPSASSIVIMNTREYHEPMKLFETLTRIVFWPENTLILSDQIVGSWDASGIKIKSNIVYLCTGDEITFCRGTNTPTLWVGHKSGRISVLKLSPAFDRVVETIHLIGHYKPINYIDINQDFSTAISCSSENYVILWDLTDITYANTIQLDGPIHEVYSSRTTGDLILLNREQNIAKLCTINGVLVGSIEPEEKIESVCLSGLDPGRNVNVVALGCDYGIIRLYSTWDLRFINQIKVLPLFTLPIKSIRYSKDGKKLYVSSRTKQNSISVSLHITDN